MGIILEERLSDSPFVERVWRSRSKNIHALGISPDAAAKDGLLYVRLAPRSASWYARK